MRRRGDRVNGNLKFGRRISSSGSEWGGGGGGGGEEVK